MATKIKMVIQIITIIIILSIVILFHELGHFFTAKITGLRVYEFGIGFPPRLFAFNRGETEYSLNLIPIGAFVKTANRETSSPASSPSKNSWRRLAVNISGPFANIILAFILFTIAFMIPITVITVGEGIQVIHIVPDSPAAKANIQEGDVILRVEGQSVESFSDIGNIIDERKGLETRILFQRDEEESIINIIPRTLYPDDEGPMGIGLGWITPHTITYRNSLNEAIIGAGSIIIHIPDMVREFIPTVVQNPNDTVFGPIGAAQITGKVIEYGIASVISMAGSISIGIALFNLLPIPPLDGAGILLAIVELARRGKSLALKKEQLIYMSGTVLLVILTVLIWYNDILRIIRG